VAVDGNAKGSYALRMIPPKFSVKDRVLVANESSPLYGEVGKVSFVVTEDGPCAYAVHFHRVARTEVVLESELA